MIVLVETKIKLSPEFRAWLRDLMSQKGLSVNALALLADVQQSALNKGLLGDRNIPNDMLVKVAPHLGVDPERMTVRADLDRIGGIERIRKHAPELLEGGAPDRPKRKESSDAIAQVVAELPAGMKHPPTQRELELLERINGFDLSELDPRSQSYLWALTPEKRWPELRQAEKDWMEANENKVGEVG